MLMKSTKNEKLNKVSLEAIIWIQFLILIVLLLFRFLYESFVFQPDSLIYPFCCLFGVLTIWVFWSWSTLTKSLFNPYLLFFLSAILFNGGNALLEIFHVNEDGIIGGLKESTYYYYYSSKNILETLLLVLIGLAAFHLGGLISLATFTVKSLKDKNFNKTRLLSKNTYKLGLRLFFISLFPAIFVLRNSISVVLSSGYNSLYHQETGTGLSVVPSILADFLVPASLFILAGSKEKPRGRLLAAIVIFIYAITRFFLGQRNQAVMPLISFAWLWHKWINPIPKLFLLSTGSLITFIILPLIAITRNTAGQDRLSINFLLESFSSIDNPVIASISEMGGSMYTVAYTLQLVPSERDFQMGTDYFYALFTIIPNIFGKRHPTIARGLAEHWLTEQVDPYFASSGGSYGFSFIAEAYLNFGWFGAPIALGVIGFLFTKLTLWAVKSSNPAKMAMVASFVSFFLFYPRAESALVVRGLVWYSLIPYLSVYVLNRSSSKEIAKLD
ncbi:oligosaccharide repeat unit polymerase [Fischerella thermalis CCMEE 5205]|nr:oligosaccharide repeat unit polymerase [Fischerella thermalis CCMEE 5205]